MKTNILGKLEKVRIQDVWPLEASHFTPWLAQEENIAQLSDEINMDLEVQGQEERVGPFRADILCRDTANDNFVLIENQYGKTDHTHLGQLMTYASGLNAVTVIWISEKFTEEHRSALDWLNSKTDETVDFFGIELELYRIGDSAPAPKFSIVSKPNNWSKTVKRTTNNEGITETKKLQQEYWSALKAYCEKEKAGFKLQKALPQHWTNIAIGRSHFHISAFANTRDSRIGVLLNISGPNALSNFRKLRELYEEQSKIEIDSNVIWDEKEGGKEHHVKLRIIGQDPLKRSEWAKQHKMLFECIDKFSKFFRDKVNSI